jgi:glucosamine kinase
MFFLGIDGGGTKTECAISDDSRILSRAIAGSCKLREVGTEAALAALTSGVQQCLTAAHITGDQITSSCAGIAGASHPDSLEWMQHVLHQLVAGKVQVVGDHIIAHAAAFADASGILVISGTGSIVYGRNAHGITARVGGHGPATSDEGSARWIVRRAVTAASSANNSPLLATLVAAAKMESAVQFATAVRNNTIDLATLFPGILAAASRGDPHAIAALSAAGQELAALTAQLIRELQMNSETATICIAGSVLQRSLIVQNALRSALRSQVPSARLDARTIDPLAGALHLARHSA